MFFSEVLIAFRLYGENPDKYFCTLSVPKDYILY